MTRRIMGKRPPRAAAASVLVCGFLAAGLATLLLGCLPETKTPQACPASVVSQAPDPYHAYWRNRYEKNRPVPPEQYQVFPKPPRDNSFGEFDNDRYQGLDTQPELPRLPADAYAPPAPPPGFGSRSAETPRNYAAAPAQSFRADAPELRSTNLPPPAGITAGTHFYPVEQLVYGGDYPDIDKPELYRLMPKDVITITVKDHPEFSGQMEIQPDGTVRVPNAPDLAALRGMTAEEAANELKRILSVYIKGECLVRVQANRARGGYYFVFGEVLQPGRFPMGIEPIKLSDAVLAANWEANPGRHDLDGDELGPSFPAASPRGRYLSPHTADLARVVLITPHRSQPARTVHDIRSAMLGVTANDPVIKPGQIVVVPSLVPGRNPELGSIIGPNVPAAQPAPPAPAGYAAPPEGKMPGHGFAAASVPSRLPDVAPPPRAVSAYDPGVEESQVDMNMMEAFDGNINSSTMFTDGVTVPAERRNAYRSQRNDYPPQAAPRNGEGWKKGF